MQKYKSYFLLTFSIFVLPWMLGITNAQDKSTDQVEYALNLLSSNLIKDSDDISIELKKIKVVSGLKNPQIFKEVVLVDEGSQAKSSDAARLNILTHAKFVKIKARKTLFDVAEIVKISEKEYILIGSGKYAVEVTTFDPEKGIDEKTVSIDLGGGDAPVPPDIPNPPPGPSPNIPDDKFENIGKRVAQWSLGLSKKNELSLLYKQAAKDLDENPSVTVSDVGAELVKKRNELIGSDTKYNVLIENLMNDLKARWPLNRKDYSEYLIAISKGLGA